VYWEPVSWQGVLERIGEAGESSFNWFWERKQLRRRHVLGKFAYDGFLS
jgi:hypothetical protein